MSMASNMSKGSVLFRLPSDEDLLYLPSLETLLDETFEYVFTEHPTGRRIAIHALIKNLRAIQQGTDTIDHRCSFITAYLILLEPGEKQSQIIAHVSESCSGLGVFGARIDYGDPPGLRDLILKMVDRYSESVYNTELSISFHEL